MSVARHTAYNFAAAVVPLAVSLITVPLYIQAIGLGRYGILSIAWLLVGYFNFFDFGLGRATAQKIAMLADAPAERRSAIFWSSAALSLALSLVAVIAFIPIAGIALGSLNLGEAALRGELDAALPLLVAAVPFAIAQSVLVGTLEGRRAFGRTGAITILGTLATAGLPLAAAYLYGPQLDHLLAATLVARTLVLVLLAASVATILPLRAPRLAPMAELRGLVGFGAWMTVTNVVSPAITFVDRLVIGATLSAAAVGIYVIPYNLVSQLVLLPSALALALFPRMAAVTTLEARRMSRDSLKVLAFLVTPAALVLLVLVGPFLDLWIGTEASRQSTPVAHLLLLGFWANSIAQIPFRRLQAGGRPDIVAKLHLAEALPYLGLLYLCLQAFGLPGAALAWSVRVGVDSLALHLLDKTDRETMLRMGRHALLLSAAAAAMILAPAWSALQLGVVGVAAVFLAILLLREFPPQIRDLIGRLPGFNRLTRTGVAE